MLKIVMNNHDCKARENKERIWDVNSGLAGISLAFLFEFFICNQMKL